jgi:maleate isomerase
MAISTATMPPPDAGAAAHTREGQEMTVEYAPRGLIGVLTPQANTTVEPEFWIMLPPGVAMINARMMSDKASLEARLIDYFDQMDTAVAQFHNAPVGAIALGTTGASYLAGIEREAEVVAAIGKRTGVPLVTAGLAVVLALKTLSARRIGLVSPYPESLTQTCVDYWEGFGLTVDCFVNIAMRPDQFHPIYSISAANAEQGLDQFKGRDIDAIVMLGTGMPTLEPILKRPTVTGIPVMSCMLCLAWASIDAVTGRPPTRDALLAFIKGEGWGERLRERMVTTGTS